MILGRIDLKQLVEEGFTLGRLVDICGETAPLKPLPFGTVISLRFDPENEGMYLIEAVIPGTYSEKEMSPANALREEE